MGDIYINGVTVRFGFDVLESRKFKRLVKNKATGTPYGVHINYARTFLVTICYEKVFGCVGYIHHRGAFGVARFD